MKSPICIKQMKVVIVFICRAKRSLNEKKENYNMKADERRDLNEERRKRK